MRVLSVILLLALDCSLVFSSPTFKFHSGFDVRLPSYQEHRSNVKDFLKELHEGFARTFVKPLIDVPSKLFGLGVDNTHSGIGQTGNVAIGVHQGAYHTAAESGPDAAYVGASNGFKGVPNKFNVVKPGLNSNIGAHVQASGPAVNANLETPTFHKINEDVLKPVIDGAQSAFEGVKHTVDNLNSGFGGAVNVNAGAHYPQGAYSKPALNSNIGAHVQASGPADNFNSGFGGAVAINDGAHYPQGADSKPALNSNIGAHVQASGPADKFNSGFGGAVNVNAGAHYPQGAASKPALNSNIGAHVQASGPVDKFNSGFGGAVNVNAGAHYPQGADSKPALNSNIGAHVQASGPADKINSGFGGAVAINDGAHYPQGADSKPALNSNMGAHVQASGPADKFNSGFGGAVNVNAGAHYPQGADSKPALNSNIGAHVQASGPADKINSGFGGAVAINDGAHYPQGADSKPALNSNIGAHVQASGSAVNANLETPTFHKINEDVSKPVIDGAQSAFEGVKHTVDNLNSAIVKPVEGLSVVERGANAASGVLNGAKTGALDIVEGIKSDFVKPVAKGVFEGASALLNSFKENFE